MSHSLYDDCWMIYTGNPNILMVIDDMKEMLNRLAQVKKINFTEHAESKIETRRIDKNTIIENLGNPNNLTHFQYEPDRYPGEKYELFFSLSKRKSLKVVISLVGTDLNVITSHIISSKRLKWVRKWQRKRK
jgi:TATA-box binding protein (TBP) (component of TFIID and TFIIIB)